MCCQRLAMAILLVLSICVSDEALGKGKGGGAGGRGFGGGGKGGGGHRSQWSGSASQGGGKQVMKERGAVNDKVSKLLSRSSANGDPLAANKKEKQLQLFQQQRDKKLAQADHLRQLAQQNGNANLAANADRMEAQALQQYADKVAQLEKFGVTDPLLNPQQPTAGGDLHSDGLGGP